VGLYNQFKEEICTKKGENLSLVQRSKRRSKRIYLEEDKKEIYLTIQVTTNYISILCREEE